MLWYFMNLKFYLLSEQINHIKTNGRFLGGHIESSDIDLLTAAKRELKEETGLDNMDLKYYKTIGNGRRDPRGIYITNVFIGSLTEIPTNIKAGSDASECKWFNLDELPDMAFDHKEILFSFTGEPIKKEYTRINEHDKDVIGIPYKYNDGNIYAC